MDPLELLDLRLADPRDEAQMIVGAPARVAARPPRADLAVLHGLGVGVDRSATRAGPRRIRRRAAVERGLEAPLHEPVVSLVVREPMRLGGEAVVGRDDVRELRPDALKRREQLRVHAQLQHGARARLGRELRVRDLVRPAAERARPLDFAQEVRAAVPARVAEGRLVDHVRAVAHRGRRALAAAGLVRDLDDSQVPRRTQMREIRVLVLEATRLQQRAERVVPARPMLEASCLRAVQLRQVDTAEVIREIARGQPQQLVDESHRTIIKGPRACGILGTRGLASRSRRGATTTCGGSSMSADRLAELQRRLAEFAAARDWDRFHSPKNLAMALSVEAAELVEELQWLTEEQSRALEPERHERVRLEAADVLIYLLRLADKLGLDLLRAADDKIALNERKYPADRVRGDSRKYTEY